MREVSELIGGRQQGGRPPVAVDNTFLGPVFQSPLASGVDLVMYSLTKYVGGHSDLVAGGVVGARDMVGPVKKLRGALGTQLDPNTAWMIMRSMETLSLRMRKSADNAALVANFLRTHAKVASVNYLGFLEASDPRSVMFNKQCRQCRVDLRLRRERRRGGGISFARCIRSNQARSQPGRHRNADLASGQHHSFRCRESHARPVGSHRRLDPHLRGHRRCG